MEQFSFWVQAIISILSGLLVLVPLAAKLVKYVRESIKEKNWKSLLVLIMNLMKEAEEKFETGAERKEWVLSELKAIQDTINYNIDWAVIGEMIDQLCAMAKKINNKTAP